MRPYSTVVKNSQSTAKLYENVPARTFDLLSKYQQEFGREKKIVAGKEDGGWRSYTISEVIDIVDRISAALLASGIQKGDRIALASRNCPQWNFIDWAIQQVGAITVPLYTTISEDDYRYNIGHSECKMLFIYGRDIYRKIVSIIPELPSIQHIVSIKSIEGVISLEEFMETGSQPTHEGRCTELQEVKASVSEDDIATIIYTSGTTGTPKGVMLTHKNLASNTKCLDALFPAGPTTVLLSYLPLSHIFEREVVAAYMNMGAVVYYAENMGTIMRDIADVRPTVFTTIPRLMEKIHSRMLLTGSKMTGVKRKIFDWAIGLGYQFDENFDNSIGYCLRREIADMLVYKKLRSVLGDRLEVIIMGGSTIQPKLAKLFAAMKTPIMEGYGLTETSPVIAVNSPVTRNIRIGTVGFPVQNIDVKISDQGEIWVKGPSVMAGYFKAPEVTQQVIDSDGYFHTGDLGRIEDGFLQLTGRMKEVFKTSMGKYISPSLVENRMMESPYISNIVVVGDAQKFAGALIVPNFEQIQHWCKEQQIRYTSNLEMIQNKEVINLIRYEVEQANKTLGDYERVQRFELLANDFDPAKDEVTSTMKIRRNVIMEHYRDTINKLFD